jgi:hypothetical protein
MYVNAKMITVENIPGIGGGRDKDSSLIYLIHCKNICKCHNIPPSSTTINKQKNKKKTFGTKTMSLLPILGQKRKTMG